MTRDLFADFLALSGTGLLSYGAWLIFQPAGYIVGGALLLITGWLLAGRSVPSQGEEGS